MALNLNSIMLGSEDPKALADCYSKVLGDPNPEWSDEANGWYGFQAGEGSLAIGPHSEVKGKSQQPGRIMLNFETSDVKAEFERIKAAGVDVVAEPYSPMGGDGDGDGAMLMCTFADPDGNYFQLSPPWDPDSM
jgi:predicted enzyme related to lactoylglutathione lyase